MAVSNVSEMENPFASPWEDSDVIFVVENKELHVHRLMLQMHSPVLKAMFERQFKEANQDKITLEDKLHDDMVAFFTLLYPPVMVKPSINEQNIMKMLAIADEYQATKLATKLLQDVVITPSNALQILPYAVKYDYDVKMKCMVTAQSSVKTEVLEKYINNEQNISELGPGGEKLAKDLLFQKCKMLEAIVERGKSTLIGFMRNSSREKDSYEYVSAICCALGHTVCVTNFPEARKCQQCLKAYQKEFGRNRVSNELLESMYDATT